MDDWQQSLEGLETMKLHISIGPNPRLVRMFALEKGAVLDEQWIDLVGGENRRQPFLDINPSGQLPVLEASSGQVICETIAICEYLDEMFDGPSLIGADASQRAEARMWTRRVEAAYCQPVTAAFRYGPGLGLFKNRVHCIPLAADEMREIAREGAAWIDAQFSDRPYLAGDRFSLPDIVLYCFADFAANRLAMPLDASLPRLARWFERVSTRLSAQETEAGAYRLPEQRPNSR